MAQDLASSFFEDGSVYSFALRNIAASDQAATTTAPLNALAKLTALKVGLEGMVVARIHQLNRLC